MVFFQLHYLHVFNRCSTDDSGTSDKLDVECVKGGALSLRRLITCLISFDIFRRCILMFQDVSPAWTDSLTSH